MSDRSYELGYDLGAAEVFVYDRNHFERRCQHYAEYTLKHGVPLTFELYRPSKIGGLDSVPVTVTPESESRVQLVGGRVVHLPDGATDAFPGLSSTLLDAMLDVVLVTDASPNATRGPFVLYCNKAFEEMTGYERRELIGKSPRMLQASKRDRSDAAARRAIARAMAARQPVRREVVNYKKDGTPFRVDLNISPAEDATGWHTHWVAIQRDMTKERRREEAQAVANRVEVATTVASGIAHDLNNQLAVAATQLEAFGEGLPEWQRRSLDRIVDSMVEMQGITRQFVALNRDTTKNTASNLVSEVNRALTLLPRRVRDFVFVRVGRHGESYVTLSGDEIGQIVLNLVLNAHHAVSETMSRPEIRVSFERHELSDGRPGIALVVTDNGPGVPAELAQKIFSPFVTTKDAGSGLGLYNVARIASQHDGTAMLRDSLAGEGAVFELLFPMVEPEQVQAAEQATSSASESTKSGRLLIVEDQEVLVRRWSSALDSYFEEISVAATVAEARQALESATPDCLLCDMNLDLVEGGIQIIEAYVEANPAGRYLITTGSPERVPGWVPTDFVLEKPFRTKRLLERVREIRAS